MSYDANLDFLSLGGQDFGGVLDGDGSGFEYTANGDTITTRKDSSGSDIDFKNVDKGGTGTIGVRHDAKTIIKLLVAYKNNGNSTTIKRDNRNENGEKVILNNVKIINEGTKGKNADGTKSVREFMFKYESEVAEEGAY